MIRVIVNADDLGKSVLVNQEIDSALNSGVITSSTILANTELWGDVHSIVDSHPDASFGVHLNLTEGKAITDSHVFVQFGVTDGNGFFTGNILKGIEVPSILADALYKELSIQIETVKTKIKIPISHIDGHHHVHTLSSISDIILNVAKDHGIKRIRNRYHLPVRFPNLGIRSTMKDVPWRLKFKKNGITIVRYFGPYQLFVDQLKRGLKPPQNSTVELMCHPGHCRFKYESAMLFEHEIERYITDIEYINYKNLF